MVQGWIPRDGTWTLLRRTCPAPMGVPLHFWVALPLLPLLLPLLPRGIPLVTDQRNSIRFTSKLDTFSFVRNTHTTHSCVRTGNHGPSFPCCPWTLRAPTEERLSARSYTQAHLPHCLNERTNERTNERRTNNTPHPYSLRPLGCIVLIGEHTTQMANTQIVLVHFDRFGCPLGSLSVVALVGAKRETQRKKRGSCFDFSHK